MAAVFSTVPVGPSDAASEPCASCEFTAPMFWMVSIPAIDTIEFVALVKVIGPEFPNFTRTVLLFPLLVMLQRNEIRSDPVALIEPPGMVN